MQPSLWRQSTVVAPSQTTALGPRSVFVGFFASYNTLLFPHKTLTRWSLQRKTRHVYCELESEFASICYMQFVLQILNLHTDTASFLISIREIRGSPFTTANEAQCYIRVHVYVSRNTTYSVFLLF
jgi:hypothetical protein